MNYSVWEIVKARWGMENLGEILLWGTILFILYSALHAPFTLVHVSGLVIDGGLAYSAVFVSCLVLSTILEVIISLGALLIYSVIVFGAKRGHRGYDQLYRDYLNK